MLSIIRDMQYSVHLYDRYYKSYFFFLFNLIFELLGILMVIINIKMELINATENCLLNVFSVRNFYYQLNHSLSILFSFGQNQCVWIQYGQTYYMTYWVMCWNWNLFFKKTIQLEKKWQLCFWPKLFHRVSI